MAVKANGNWISLSNPKPDFWCDQAYAFRGAHVTSVRLVKKMAGGPENGLEIQTTPGDKSLFNRFWMRYETLEEAAQDYADLLLILHDGDY